MAEHTHLPFFEDGAIAVLAGDGIHLHDVTMSMICQYSCCGYSRSKGRGALNHSGRSPVVVGHQGPDLQPTEICQQ